MGQKSKNAWVIKDGQPIYDFLHDTIRDSVLEFMNNQQLAETHECWELFQNLQQNNHSLTFSDLDNLVNVWPEQFKRLTVVATKEDGGELKIFNAQESPNVGIAIACRASGAIPAVLTPVEIEGVQYIDGGVHDNIPTEVFDKNPITHTYENNHPENTLVFAFSGGKKHNEKSIVEKAIAHFLGDDSIFAALHGSRLDESDAPTLFLDCHDDKDSKNNIWSWIQSVFAKISFAIVAIWTFICSFFPASTNAKPDEIAVTSPTTRPTLFDPHPFVLNLYNQLPKLFSAFKSDYRVSDKIEESYQRIRSRYPLRTAALGVGNLSPLSFEQATKHARFMSVRGYLDTMNSILSHELYLDGFEPCEFYCQIIDDFTARYKELVIASGKDPETDGFLRTLDSHELSILSRYYLIKETAELDPTSDEAFALTRAVEFRKKELTKEDLLAEVDARCHVLEKKPSTYDSKLNLLFKSTEASEPRPLGSGCIHPSTP